MSEKVGDETEYFKLYLALVDESFHYWGESALYEINRVGKIEIEKAHESELVSFFQSVYYWCLKDSV